MASGEHETLHSAKPGDTGGLRDEVVPILDFGSQTAQLIARRAREAGVYAVLVHPSISADELRAMQPRGIILSGGPSSVDDEGAPSCDPAIFSLGVPVLGICYGMQLACKLMGARVDRAEHREFGRASQRRVRWIFVEVLLTLRAAALAGVGMAAHRLRAS